MTLELSKRQHLISVFEEQSILTSISKLAPQLVLRLATKWTLVLILCACNLAFQDLRLAFFREGEGQALLPLYIDKRSAKLLFRNCKKVNKKTKFLSHTHPSLRNLALSQNSTFHEFYKKQPTDNYPKAKDQTTMEFVKIEPSLTLYWLWNIPFVSPVSGRFKFIFDFKCLDVSWLLFFVHVLQTSFCIYSKFQPLLILPTVLLISLHSLTFFFTHLQLPFSFVLLYCRARHKLFRLTVLYCLFHQHSPHLQLSLKRWQPYLLIHSLAFMQLKFVERSQWRDRKINCYSCSTVAVASFREELMMQMCFPFAYKQDCIQKVWAEAVQTLRTSLQEERKDSRANRRTACRGDW